MLRLHALILLLMAVYGLVGIRANESASGFAGARLEPLGSENSWPGFAPDILPNSLFTRLTAMGALPIMHTLEFGQQR